MAKKKCAGSELRKAQARKNKDKWEGPFLVIWRGVYPDLPIPERDFKFHPKRKWKADFAIEAAKVLVELHGGGARGRHSSVTGHAADCEKLNEAQKLGWIVMQYTVLRLKDMASVVDEVAAVVEGRLPKKKYKCPECLSNTDGNTHTKPNGEQCDMVRGRRGWRQLGVYDG
jgi:hypothetical protein